LKRRADDDDVLPTETIALVIYKLARVGHLTTKEAADIGSYTTHGVDSMLNKAARVLPIEKPERGHWALRDEVTELAEQLTPVLWKLEDELKATPHGIAYCHPLKRSDMVTIYHALKALLRESA
jgi:hypothetical protein